MQAKGFRSIVFVVLALAAAMGAAQTSAPGGTTYEALVTPGANYDKAEFRLWTALLSKAARDVPGLLFTGEKDMAFRSETIAGLFAVNRRAGALWAIAQEPGVAHAVGRSIEMSLVFFDEVLPLRLGPAGSDASSPAGLRPLSEKSGFIGDPVSKTIQAVEKSGVPNRPTAWLPTERAARAWLAVVTGNPFDR